MGDFGGGYINAKKGKKWGYLNAKGEAVTEFKYDKAEEIVVETEEDKYANIVLNGKNGYVKIVDGKFNEYFVE